MGLRYNFWQDMSNTSQEGTLHRDCPKFSQFQVPGQDDLFRILPFMYSRSSLADQPDFPEVSQHAGMDIIQARGSRDSVGHRGLARLQQTRPNRCLAAMQSTSEAVGHVVRQRRAPSTKLMSPRKKWASLARVIAGRNRQAPQKWVFREDSVDLFRIGCDEACAAGPLRLRQTPANPGRRPTARRRAHSNHCRPSPAGRDKSPGSHGPG